MTYAGRALVLVLALAAVPRAWAQPASDAAPPPCAACVVVELSPESAIALTAGASPLSGAEVLIRTASGAISAETIGGLARRGLSVVLESPVGELPDPALLQQADALVLDVRSLQATGEAAAFTVKAAATRGRATKAGLRVGIDADASRLADLSARGAGAYLDFAVVPPGTPVAPGSDVRVWVRDRPRAGLDAVSPPSAGAERVVRSLPPQYVETLADLRGVLTGNLVPQPDMGVRCVPECRSAMFLNPDTLESIAIVNGGASVDRLFFEPAVASARMVRVTEAGRLSDTRIPTGGDVAPATDEAGAFIVIAPGAAQDAARFASAVHVSAKRSLSLDEILARHHAARARQRAVVRSLITEGTTTLMFETPGFPAPLTVGAQTRMFARDGLLEVEQHEIRVNGLALATGRDGVPRLPLIDAERLATAPLTLTLNAAYRYRLGAEEAVESIPCYVIEFESARVTGRAWVSKEDFGIARMTILQEGGRGPIVSSEQRDEFVRRVERGTPVWLPRRTEIHQVYEGPTHRTPIHRVIETASHEINPPDFDERLHAARAGSSVMLRDTPDGFRYLERMESARAESVEAATREVARDRSDRVRSAAFGLIIDPNITRPLPFAGVNYLDFNLWGTGTQVNVFAGAGFGRASLMTAGIGGTRWQIVGDAFAIAAQYNDRVFASGREQHELNLRQRPLHAMVGVARPILRTVRLRGEYHTDYTQLQRGDTTDAAFVVPPSPLVHAARIALDMQRGPWSGGVWWSPAIRQRWTRWGVAGSQSGADAARASRERDFQRYGASIARTFVVSPRTAGRVDAAWMDGRDLDRFSRFTFGTFDNRLRGYPSAAIRYDRGLVLHTALSQSASSRLRLDGFFDVALVNDASFGGARRTYPGLGAAVEVPLPFGLLTTVEWTYGVRGVSSSARAGTHVVRFGAYKMF